LFVDNSSAEPVATAKDAAMLSSNENGIPIATANGTFETLPEDVAAALGKEWEQLTTLLND
jgi:hypothetical protein